MKAFCCATSSSVECGAAASAARAAAERNGWPHGDTSERSSRSSAGKQKPGPSRRNAGDRGSPRSDSAARVDRSAARSRWHASAARCRDRGSVRKPRMCSSSGSGRSRIGDGKPAAASSAMRRGDGVGWDACAAASGKVVEPFLFLSLAGREAVGGRRRGGMWPVGEGSGDDGHEESCTAK
ncbi:hypothetical protein GQ55_4G334200 [Panicum hallii var. hallii]|uniref:Uncharacterized protein n=1 Tax=Panicum hallii var. hallii TaxID=1504633 RepID=A0A2T7E2X9_9POAL|nr:hypothetical protein GQ55_4G334200 [Panicum hallii var. hallii]